MEGTYDDDFHLDKGFESFDDWFSDWERNDNQNEFDEEVNLEKSFRS